MTQFTPSENFVLFQKKVRSVLLGSATCLALSGLATPAMAQEAAEEEDSEIIIVTARAQAESLQETPVNITSLASATLDTFQVNEIADVVSRVPGLNVQVGGSGAGAQISLRGLGSSNISSAFDSAVGLDFDGVQVSTQRLLQTGFFDVQQIDVLKGPQSLYFGKSASAGVLSLKSANPTSVWEFSAKGSYEFEEDGYTIGGYISGPISETLGIRIAAQYQDLNKYVQIEPQVAVRDRNKGLTNFIGRLTLNWEPTDNFTANLKINYNKQDSETILGHSDLGCGPDGLISPTTLVGAVVFQSSHSCNINDGRYPDSDGDPRLNKVFAGTTGDGRDLSQPYNETDIFYARLAMDLNLTDTLKLSTVSGYVDLFNEYNGNFNYTGNCPAANFNPRTGCSGGAIAAGFMAPFRNELIQFTQEARLTSDFDGAFNFQLGAFWEDRNMPYGTSQNAFVAAFIAPTTNGETFDWYAERDSKAQALSFFGSAYFDITEQLELSGGIRWTKEKKSTTVRFPFVHDVITFGFGFLPSGFFAGPVRFSDSNWSPEVALKYKASDDVNIYAAFKTGFKSGGIDNNALPSGPLRNLNSPDPAVRAAIEDGLRFESETSKGGEIGIRSQFADRSVTLNATAFYYSFKDLQIQEFSLALFNFETYNASKVVTKGLDIDWAWAPTDGLKLFGAMSYTDTKYAENIVRPNLSVALVDGRTVARAPKFSGNIAFDWRNPIGDSLEVGLSGNATYSDSYWTNPVDTDYRQPSYVTFDASISVGDPDGKWKLSLIGTNLTDEIWTNTTGGAPFSADDKVHTQNRGRQIFVEAGFKF